MTPERPAWLPLREWPFALNWITVDSQQVHYVDEGRGPTLLFVHAGFWSFVWRDVIRGLRDRFRCVALDFPGHGLSQAANGYQVSLERHSRLLEAFIDGVGIESATFVLHDLGGPIGLQVASKRPAAVHGIVASQTFAWPPDIPGLRVALRVFGSRPIEFVNRLTNIIPRASAGAFGLGRHLTTEGRKAFLGPFRSPGPRRTFHRLIRSATQSRGFLTAVEQGLLTELSDQHVLTVFGEKNDPFGYQARFKVMFPGARQVVVNGGRHFPMSDDPAMFAAEIAEWRAHGVR